MRICPNCGRENPEDRTICSCGFELQPGSGAPSGGADAAGAAAGAGTGATDSDTPAHPSNGSSSLQAVATPPPRGTQPPNQATLLVYLPGEEPSTELAIGVVPGERERLNALIRNRSRIVDNYELKIPGIPEDWYSIFPGTVYLVPYGAPGTYEQEVEIYVHPPRSPEAAARIWDVTLTAHSKAHDRVVASAHLLLGIQPYEDHESSIRPQRVAARLKAEYMVTVTNNANATMGFALNAQDTEEALRYTFEPEAMTIAPGESLHTKVTATPIGQIWLGRGSEHQIEVIATVTDAIVAIGDPAISAPGPAVPAGELGAPVTHGGGEAPDGPRESTPARSGEGEALDAPAGSTPLREQDEVQQPEPSTDLAPAPTPLTTTALRIPSHQGETAPATIAGTRIPARAAFRQKAWIPVWVPVLIALLAVAIPILLSLRPNTVTVPDLTRARSTFQAQLQLEAAGLKLNPKTLKKITTEAPPGSILRQTPRAGNKVDKGTEVTVLVAARPGKITVPNLEGKTPIEADKILRDAGLTLGQVSPPTKLERKIETQLPAADEVVKPGTPVNVILAAPKKAASPPSSAVKVPTPGAGDTPAEVAAAAAKAGLKPVQKRVINKAAAGTVIKTSPKAGAKVEKGDKLTILVSAGFPQVVFANGDIARANGATGKRLSPVANGNAGQPLSDPSWNPNGTQVAFIRNLTSDLGGGGKVLIATPGNQNDVPVPISPTGENYTNVAWAPTRESNVLALVEVTSTQRRVCWGRITVNGIGPQCKSMPGYSFSRTLRWTTDGRSVFAFATGPNGVFGMVRFTTKKPFSANPDNWTGRFVTPTDQPGKGAIDLAISPDGEKMTVVQNFESDSFQVAITERNDFELLSATQLGVDACLVDWRSDNKELLMVNSRDCLQDNYGLVFATDLKGKKIGDPFTVKGNNPDFQPISLSG